MSDKGNAEMVSRLKAELDRDGPRVRNIAIPHNIGWVPCPNCSLPFQPGGRLYFDVQTKRGVCEGCEQAELEEKLELPF